MQYDDSSYSDRKHQRRDNITRKKSRPKNSEPIDHRDQSKLNKAFKHKKREIYEEEIWEEWQDEIY